MNELSKRYFAVRGTGPFPFDMLRYDQCWPHREMDSSLMRETDYDEERVVNLCSYGPTGPTHRRWKSFGWTVL